jgi:hypothetical protein
MASSSPVAAEDGFDPVQELELAEDEGPTLFREEPAVPEVAPHRILVIGDSHTAGTFGRALDLLLRTLPKADVKTVGSCGLSPDGFLQSKGTRCGYLEIDDNKMAFKTAQGLHTGHRRAHGRARPRPDHRRARRQPDQHRDA